MSGGAYNEHILSIHSAYIEHTLQARGRVDAIVFHPRSRNEGGTRVEQGTMGGTRDYGWNKGLWVEQGSMGGTRDLHKGVPSLGGEGHGIAVTRDETEVDGLLSFFGSGTATVLYIDRGVLGGSDVANDVDVVKGNEFLVVVDVAGEEELIVFAAVECAGDDIEVHLFGERRSLVVDRQFVLVDIAPYPRLRAYMEELRG